MREELISSKQIGVCASAQEYFGPVIPVKGIGEEDWFSRLPVKAAQAIWNESFSLSSIGEDHPEGRCIDLAMWLHAASPQERT